MFTLEALQILLFLVPGFLSEAILNSLIVRMPKKELQKIVEALIFSLIIYTIHSLISNVKPISMNFETVPPSFSYNSSSLLLLLFIAIVIPLVMGFMVTNDWHMKVARSLRITRKTARSSVWFDVFCDKKKHIIVNFENGRRLYGWPEYYSNTPENPCIFLSKPSWIMSDEETGENRYIDLDIEGILITPEQKIDSIEFL